MKTNLATLDKLQAYFKREDRAGQRAKKAS